MAQANPVEYLIGARVDTTFASFANTAPRFLDIGAHTGVYSLLACAAKPSCEAFCFEPFPATFTRLESNLRINGFLSRCHAVQAAVSNRSGAAKLVKIDVEGHEGMSRTIAGSRPTIFFECNPGGPARNIENILRDRRYAIFSLLGARPRLFDRLVPENFRPSITISWPSRS